MARRLEKRLHQVSDKGLIRAGVVLPGRRLRALFELSKKCGHSFLMR
jgi:hypothetical protein